MSIFGRSYGRNITGRIYKRGEEIKVRSVSEAIDHGLASLPLVRADRRMGGRHR